MDVKLLQKIEELTLYVIAQDKRIDKLQKKLDEKKMIIMQHLRFTIVAFFISVCFFSCRQEPKKTPVYFNTEFKSGFNYQIGSFWVFYDSLNKNKDSLSVLTYDYLKPFFDGQTPNEISNIEMQFFDSPATANIVALSIKLTSPSSLALFFGFGQPITVGSFEYPTDLVNGIPFSVGKVTINVGDFIGYCDRSFIGNMKINGATYSNVYKTEYNNTHLSTDDIFYFNTDNGFLEILFHNPYVDRKLYLIHYNLIR